MERVNEHGREVIMKTTTANSGAALMKRHCAKLRLAQQTKRQSPACQNLLKERGELIRKLETLDWILLHEYGVQKDD